MTKRLAVLLTLLTSLVWLQTALSVSSGQEHPGLTSETDKQIQSLQDRVKKVPGDAS
jgi:hypothetical protein